MEQIQNKKCPLCEQEILKDSSYKTEDGKEICDDCFFDYVDTILEEHPIF